MSENSTLNSYKVLESISHSRRFSLYHAVSIASAQEVLIKTPDSLQGKNQNLISALMAEAEAAKALSHPSIRAYYASQNEEGAAFFVGEYFSGETLARKLSPEQDPLPQETALLWIKELFSALDYAHGQGVNHLNLNPYNIIIDKDLHLKIIGFGKSKNAWLNGEDGFMPWHPVLFVAPETFQAGLVHRAADLFSAAAVAYLIFCQSLPWRVDQQLSYEKQKQQSLCRAVIMPEILKKDMPDWLFSILLACLKLDPTQRPSSALEILQIIEQETRSADEQPDLPREPEPESAEEEAIPEPASEPEAVPLPEAETIEEPASEPFTLQILEDEATLETIPEPEPEPVPEPEAEPEPVPEPEPPLVELDNDDSLVSLFASLEEDEKPEPSPVPITDSLELEEDLSEQNYAAKDVVSERVIDQNDALESVNTPDDASENVVVPDLALESVNTPEVASESYTTPALPKPRTPLYQADPLRRKQKPEATLDTSALQKTFKMLLWLSLGVLLFVVIKYVVFAKRPKFEAVKTAPQIEEPEARETLANEALRMVLVKGDTLVMGNTGPEAQSDEFPLLTLPVRTFYISPREITQKEWLMINPENPSRNQDKDLPVENVSFYDIIEYCNAKSLKDGFQPCYDFFGEDVNCNFEADGYRLPTEAEWEFAAKAGERYNSNIYSGSDNPDEIGWHSGNSEAQLHRGAGKKPNKLGIYDLSGNLYEWVWNWYAPYSYRHDPATGPEKGTDRVIRGGSWYHASSEMRVTNRFHAKPFVKTNYIGFRVVRSANGE